MANKVWSGNSIARAQINTVTPANVNIGNVFNLTINGKIVTFTATAATVANVTAGLAAAWALMSEPEWQEVTVVDNTTNVLVTAVTKGQPFTQTSNATGGTATNLTAPTVTALSPNHWDIADNWLGSVIPTTADDIIVPDDRPPILWNIDQNALSINSIVSGNTPVGLPERNVAGYAEYRTTYLKIRVATVTVGYEDGTGPDRFKLDSGSVIACALTVRGSGQGVNGEPAVCWKGTHSSSSANIPGGDFGAAALPGEVATLLTLKFGNSNARQCNVVGGVGLTLATLTATSGNAVFFNTVATANLTGPANVTVQGAAASTTINVDDGTLVWNSIGTLANLKVADPGLADFSRTPISKAVTNCTVYGTGKLFDPNRTVAWGSAIQLVRRGLHSEDLDVGEHLAITVAAGA